MQGYGAKDFGQMSINKDERQIQRKLRILLDFLFGSSFMNFSAKMMMSFKRHVAIEEGDFTILYVRTTRSAETNIMNLSKKKKFCDTRWPASNCSSQNTCATFRPPNQKSPSLRSIQ
jgi:hypothetical protein